MSALAMILAKSGYSISGSDQKKSALLQELASNSTNIFATQEESNIDKIIKNKKKYETVLQHVTADRSPGNCWGLGCIAAASSSCSFHAVTVTAPRLSSSTAKASGSHCAVVIVV